MIATTQEGKFRIWGIWVEPIYSDDVLIWRLFINNPFYQDARWRIGINEKLLRLAISQGVSKFLVKVGEKEIPMRPPTTKEINRKIRRGEYEEIPSLFAGSKPMRILHFII